jgi:hypothetical protein
MSIDEQISKYPTCADRIHEHFQSRSGYLEEMMEALYTEKPFDGYEDAFEAYANYPLALTKYTTYKIELSWGGPSDYIELTVDDDYNIITARYHFADWFDHASINVDEDSGMYKYLQEFIRIEMECGA